MLLYRVDNMNRLPFNWKNPIGYLIAVALECTLLLNPLRYMATMMTIGFAIFVFAIEFSSTIVDDMRALNKCAKVKRSQQKHIHDLLSHCIDTHSDVKKFSKL